MAKKQKGLYYDRFMAKEYDSDALVQDYKGNVILPIAGHVYVVRTFFGFYKIIHNEKQNAEGILPSLSLKIRFPFSQVKLIKNMETTAVIELKDPILTHDGLNATPAPGGFTFKYEVLDDKENYKKLYNLNDDAMKNVKASIQQIIGFIVNRGTMDEVKKTFNINFSDNIWWPEWINDSDDINILKDMYSKIEREYGIKITEIMTVDFNEPTRVVQANEELKAAESEKKTADIRRKIVEQDNEVEIAKANAEAKIRIEEARKKAEIEAEKEAKVAAAKADAEINKQKSILNERINALKAYFNENNFSEIQKIKMITCVLNPNATHVDFGEAVTLLNKLDSDKKDVLNKQSTISNQQSSVDSQQTTVQAQQIATQDQHVSATVDQSGNQKSLLQSQNTTTKKPVKSVHVFSRRKGAKSDKKTGVRGVVPTPRRHSDNIKNDGHGMSLR